MYLYSKNTRRIKNGKSGYRSSCYSSGNHCRSGYSEETQQVGNILHQKTEWKEEKTMVKGIIAVAVVAVAAVVGVVIKKRNK